MNSELHFKKIKHEDKGVLVMLHEQAFPGEHIRDFSDDTGWLVMRRKTIVGFCTVAPLNKTDAFLSRAGSFKPGIGIHKATIRHRLRWLKRHGYKWAVTYVSHDNYNSVGNLIRCGFRFYKPEWQYAGPGYFYLQKKI